jgi:preprotein translocase subunit YajC
MGKAVPGSCAKYQRKETPVLGNISLASALASSSKGSSGSSEWLLIIVVLVVIFYIVMIRPQSKRRRQVMQQQRAVQPGQRVRTTAGMYATVVAVEDDDVILEVAPGVESRFVKRAIMEVLPDDNADGTGYDGEPFTETDAEGADVEDSTVDAPAEEDGETGEPADSGLHDEDTPHHEDVPEETRTSGSV